jgi:response regulator RpfG family c-di-GMP phosphodiesterase
MLNRPTVLIVDDELGPREALRMILKEKYNVMTASSGPLALQFISREPVDVTILDIKMLGMDGIEVLKEIKKEKPDIEVIMVTAYASLETAKEAIKHGAIDYLIKPFDRKEVEEVTEKAVKKREEFLKSEQIMEEFKATTEKLTKQIQGFRQQIAQNYEQTIKSLIAAIDARDSYTKNHSELVAGLCGLLAQEAGWPKERVDQVVQAARIHDIGKIAVSESILRKPGPLTKKELDIMKRHPLIGVAIINPIELLTDIIPIVRSHHERYDGSGYPDGLKGEGIPEGARIVAVADAIVAMFYDRPYRKGLSLDAIRTELKDNSGKQFDPKYVEIALKFLTGQAVKDGLTIPSLYKVSG